MDPPAVPVCLTKAYSSSPDQKGGTFIAVHVVGVARHEELLADPDGYRPEACGSCGCMTLHAHDFRSRKFGEGDEVTFRRYRCKVCRGVWMVLAAFVARHLHQRWARVQSAVEGSDTSVPLRTLMRWMSRLRCSGVLLTQLLTESLPDLRLEMSCTRGELVDALVEAEKLDSQRKLSMLAAWIHRLRPGLRLM